MKKNKARWIFLIFLLVTVVSPILFIQSRFFAKILTNFAKNNILIDFGVDGGFDELSVKMFPPGVVIINPSLKMKHDNAVGIPEGTQIDAKSIEVTFQFFQILTGIVNVNGIVINGANLDLIINNEFFAALEKRQKEKRKLKLFKKNKEEQFNLETLMQFNFKSIGFVDTNFNLNYQNQKLKDPILLKTLARELTIGKGVNDQGAVIDIGIDLGETEININKNIFKLYQLHSGIALSSKDLEIRNFALQDETRSIQTSGKIIGDIFNPSTLKSDIAFNLKGPVEDWVKDLSERKLISLPKDVKLDGIFRAEGSLRADLLNFQNTSEITTEIEIDSFRYADWSGKSLSLHLNQSPKGTSISKIDAEMSDGGRIRGQISEMNLLGHLSSGLPLSSRVTLDLNNIDFHQALGPMKKKIFPLKFKASGNISTQIELVKKKTNSELSSRGNIDLAITQFQFDNQNPDVKKEYKLLIGVPELKLGGGFVFNPTGLFIEEMTARLPRSEMKVRGKITSAEGFNLQILGAIQMEDLGKLAAFDIGGKGYLDWTIKGVSPDIFFTFDTKLQNAKYLDLNLGDVDGRVVWEDGPGILKFYNLKSKQGRLESRANGWIDLANTDQIDLDIEVPNGSIQDFAILFSNFLKRSVPWYPYELVGLMSGKIKVSGKTDLDKLSILSNMDLMNMEYHNEVFRTGHLKNSGFSKGNYIVEKFNLLKKNGSFNGFVKFSDQDVLDYSIKSEGLTTLDFDRLAYLDIPYRAGMAFQSEGQGKIGQLKSVTTLNIGNGNVKNYSIPSSQITLHTENGRLKSNANLFNNRATAKIDYGWSLGSNSTFEGNANDFDFLPILVAINPNILDMPDVRSNVRGSAKLNYKTGSAEKVNGVIQLDHYELDNGNGTIQLEKPVRLLMNDGDYEFSGARIFGENTDIKINGKVKNQITSYVIDGGLNLKILELIVPELQNVSGVIGFHSTVTGSVLSPTFKLNGLAEDISVKARSLLQSFENLTFKVDWLNENITVSEIVSKYAGGKIYGSGNVVLFANQAPKLNFNFNLDNPKITTYPVVYARMNGKLTVFGDDLPYKVKGKFQVIDALIRENFNSNEGAKTLKVSKFMPSINSKKGGNNFELFDLDLDLKADRGILVKNDLFDGEVKGNLNILKSIRSPSILGKVNVIHGKLLFKDSYFTISSGELLFNNPAILDPEINVSGQTELKGYKIFLISSGKTSDYQLSFQSQPILTQNDIVNLLTFGVTSAGYENIARGNREAYTRDEMYGLIFNQTSINKGIQEKLGVKVKLDSSQSGIANESAFRAHSGDASTSISPRVVLQKQVTKNLSASAGTTVGVGEGKQQNLDLEYNIGKSWSLNGVYEDQRGSLPANSRSSMGADLKFKVRFK